MRLAEIWRHPIKAHGREAIDAFEIAPGGTIPFDRHWAVAHEAARLDGSNWVACGNFTRGAKTPALMAITARMEDGLVTLSHPERPDLAFDPDGDGRAFLDWIAPLTDAARAVPTGILRAGGRGFTDTDFPSVSLANAASHAAVEDKAHRPLSRHRWRANLWIDGAAPWAEFDWIGREAMLGSARFRVAQRITRCRATMADPATGKIDADTLGTLDAGWGHRDFGIHLVCVEAGRVEVGDTLDLA